MSAPETEPVECIHGLIGCAPCQGIDESTGPDGSRYAGHVTPWSDEDNRIASDYSLASRDVAAALNRTINNVSAHRIGQLGMTGYPRYTARPRRRRPSFA